MLYRVLLVMTLMVASFGVLAPASGQAPCVPGRYVVCPTEEPTPDPTEGQIRQTTPCGTIIVTGDNWGSSTVTIDREFDSDDCPGEPGAPDVIEQDPVNPSDEAAFAASRESTIVADVAEDGTFSVVLQVPADVDTDTYEVRVSGQDLSGQAKNQTYTYNVTPTAAFTPNTADSATSSNTAYAIAALLIASILLVGLNWQPLIRRIRR